MTRSEMMALSNQGGTLAPSERASAWLLARLGESHGNAAGWMSTREIEVARSRSGVRRKNHHLSLVRDRAYAYRSTLQGFF